MTLHAILLSAWLAGAPVTTPPPPPTPPSPPAAPEAASQQTRGGSQEEGAWLARRPPIGEPETFDLPDTEALELDNGVEATFIPFGLTPKTTISVRVQTGNLNEGENTWLSDVTAELMKEGADGRSGEAIALEAAEMGGSLKVWVDPHFTALNLSVLSSYAPEAVALLADIVQRPELPESEIDRVKADFVRTLSIARSESSSLAAEAFLKALYGDHPYGRVFPTAEQLQSYEIDDARAYYEENFGGERTHIYIAGRYDRAAVEEAVHAEFGEWKAGPQPLVAPPDPQAGPRVILVNREDAPQTTLYLGKPAIGPAHADAIALETANALLGGSFISRITQNIREDKGFTYSPSSYLYYNYQDGYWRFKADVATESTGPALREVFSEIERLAGAAPSKDEAQRARNYLSGIFVLKNAAPDGLITQLAFTDFQELPASYLEDYTPSVMAVEAEDIRQVTETWLDPSDMVLVAVGDLDAIQPQLAELRALSGLEFEVEGGTGADDDECRVLTGDGFAQSFGVCTTAELIDAIAIAEVVETPREAAACTIRTGGAEPEYEGCDDFSGPGLAALTESAS